MRGYIALRWPNQRNEDMFAAKQVIYSPHHERQTNGRCEIAVFRRSALAVDIQRGVGSGQFRVRGGNHRRHRRLWLQRRWRSRNRRSACVARGSCRRSQRCDLRRGLREQSHPSNNPVGDHFNSRRHGSLRGFDWRRRPGNQSWVGESDWDCRRPDGQRLYRRRRVNTKNNSRWNYSDGGCRYSRTIHINGHIRKYLYNRRR